MIIIKNARANVPTEVVDTIREVSRTFIRGIEHQTEANPRSKDFILKRNAFKMAKHVKVLDGNTELDLIVTQLRNLPFTEYGLVTVPDYEIKEGYSSHKIQGSTYLYGITKDIICARSRDGRINLGPYKIYLPLPIVGIGTGGKVLHFVPQLEPHVWGRFYHHHAVVSWEGDMTDPAQMDGGTCWGGFDVNAIIESKMAGDIFTILHRYLQTANMRSLLVHRDLAWGKPIK